MYTRRGKEGVTKKIEGREESACKKIKGEG
jgi:hypothetical protein